LLLGAFGNGVGQDLQHALDVVALEHFESVHVLESGHFLTVDDFTEVHLECVVLVCYEWLRLPTTASVQFVHSHFGSGLVVAFLQQGNEVVNLL